MNKHHVIALLLFFFYCTTNMANRNPFCYKRLSSSELSSSTAGLRCLSKLVNGGRSSRKKIIYSSMATGASLTGTLAGALITPTIIGPVIFAYGGDATGGAGAVTADIITTREQTKYAAKILKGAYEYTGAT